GATFRAVLAGEDEERLILASDAGYGFLAKLGDLHTRNKAGKVTLTVPDSSKVLTPLGVANPESDWLAVATARGRLLLFPAKELPELERGKGNKLIDIHAADFSAGQDRLAAWACLREGQGLRVYAASRSLNLKPVDLERFKGNRARRGQPLPNAVARVTKLEVV
ncbi:MAG TPA: DNA gyrase C-terminal beta-propeller domain-containing protein, partial [Methylococcaceae bacterium]|nr:DNA gyrase C-terminal beta-propeller domain-containing protein [Methylococcaceae bacterium]